MMPFGRTRLRFRRLGAFAVTTLVTVLPLRTEAAWGFGSCEDFENGLGSWSIAATGAATAGIGTQVSQSPTHSLFTEGGAVTVTSAPVDTSGAFAATLSVWISQGSVSFSDPPEPGDGLVLQWRTSATGWTDFETFEGTPATPGGAVFTRTYVLPDAALAVGFQVRFRQLDGSPNEDYWHIDDVCLGAGSFSHYELDETSWTGAAGQVKDSGGNGLDGTAVGGAVTADTNPTPALPGNPGTCRYGRFDGVNDYVEIPDDPLLDLPTELTVAAWVRLRSTPAELRTIVSKDTNYEFHVNSARQVYWWWHDAGGVAHTITTAATINLNQWQHVAITYRNGSQVIYIDGVASGTSSRTEQLETNDLPLYIGTDWNFISRAFDGEIDEVYVVPRALSQAEIAALRTKAHPCGSAGAQFTINHDGFGIHCVPERVAVNVIDSVAGTPLTSYNARVQLDTQTGYGTWSLVSGSGAFSDGTANDGAATYDWPLGESQAVFSLYYPSGPPAVDVDVFQVSNSGIRDTDAEGPLVFSASGFTVTAVPLPNPPGSIVPFSTSEVAGSSFALHLTAYGQTPTDPSCGVIESYSGTKSLKFWSQYSNPTSGTRNVTIDAVPVATTEGGAVAQNVKFVNGQAAVSAKYKDVGSIKIAAKDDGVVDAAQLPDGIRGATANFVVKPYDFVLSGIANAAGTVANPQATDAAGAVFVPAGSPFRATVTVRDAEGSPTPNYGKETPAESVRLDVQLLAPAGGAAPGIGATAGFGPFTNGIANGTDFTWSEVGIIRLRPAVADADYLGAGDVTAVSSSESIGRFVPYRFATALNTPLLTTGCTAGGFTFEGQPFGYATAPVITVIPVAAGGTTTTNYTGAFFKLANATLQNRTYSSGAGTLDTSGIPLAGADPIVAAIGGGNATLTFAAGSGLAFTKATLAPYQAGVRLSIDVLDADGVAAANPVVFGASGGIGFSAGQEIRLGRLRLANALGSERVDLPVKMQSEYFAGAGAGFVPNGADNCTTNVALTFSGYSRGLSVGETCVRDGGAPGASGLGCAVPAAQPFRQPPVAGDFDLRLAAPGVGNQGGVIVTATVPDWLKFDWNTATPGEENPAAQATFGIFGGESRRIYTREVY